MNALKHLTAMLPLPWLNYISFWATICAFIAFALGTGFVNNNLWFYGIGLLSMLTAILSAWSSGYHTARDEQKIR